MERYVFRPWGRQGGLLGCTGYTTLNPGTPRETGIGKIDVLRLEPGAVIRVGTQGGGGYGEPLEREPERVLAEVQAGLVSSARAREDYGVVTDGGAVDGAATEALRAAMLGRRAGSVPAFSYGPERDAYERLWPDPLRTAVVHAFMPYPGRLRSFLWERVSRLVEERAQAGETVTPEAVPDLVAATLAGLRY